MAVKKEWSIAGVLVGAVFTAILILLFSFKFVVIDVSYQSSLISSSDSKFIHEQVMQYVLGHSSDLFPVFSGSESSHLFDVKNFFSGVFISLYVFLTLWIITLFSLQDKQLVKKSLRFGAVFSLAVLLLFFIVSIFSFSAFWNVLHAPFFSDGSWVFPSDSLLITLYPESFFSALALRWGLIVFFSSVVVGILQYYLNGSGGGGGGH